ncbi:MAG TPA: secretin N-terminal domain-containing protein [Thermoanaerobaculia bacterium]|nr:secretin N-terminal domain-containing protein [Thermoanaerobaculia bacterium]
MKRFFFFALTLLLVCGSAMADDAGDVGKSLSVRTFQFKHKQAENAASVIKALLSVEGSMSIQPSANSLVVTDAPENLKKIAATLLKFDTEAQSFRLAVRLVSASRLAEGEKERMAAELRDVAPNLKVLRYNAFDAVGAADVLGKEGEAGIVDLNGYRADFRFGEYDPASDSIKLSDFKLARLEGDQLSPMLKTTLNLKLGQTVIIGATKQANSQRALMIVVSATR